MGQSTTSANISALLATTRIRGEAGWGDDGYPGQVDDGELTLPALRLVSLLTAGRTG
jgi:hypothetical protein